MNLFSFFENIFSNIENSAIKKSKLFSDVEDWLKSYFSENLELEKRCVAYFENRSDQERENIFSLKNEIHSKYWRANTDYYKPSGISSSIKHDWEKVENLDILQNNDSENRYAIVNYTYEKTNYSILIKFIESKIYIEHLFF